LGGVVIMTTGKTQKIEPSDVPYLTKGITACLSQAKKNDEFIEL
jgi:hypothetical protein